jgi:hypothetical protein
MLPGGFKFARKHGQPVGRGKGRGREKAGEGPGRPAPPPDEQFIAMLVGGQAVEELGRDMPPMPVARTIALLLDLNEQAARDIRDKLSAEAGSEAALART